MRSDVLAPSELEGTDYLLSSTMRLEDSFLQILGECFRETTFLNRYLRIIVFLFRAGNIF